MKKILVVSSMKKGGGISELVFKYYSLLQKDADYQIDVLSESGSNEFKEELIEQGIHCYYVTPFKKNPIKYFLNWNQFLKSADYDYIHAHIDNYVRFAPYILLKNQPEKLIIHSHNSDNKVVKSSKIKKMIHDYIKRRVEKSNFTKVACSKSASQWLFGDDKSKIIYNGINLDKFQFSESKRNTFREKYGFDKNDKVILHVGRFAEQKNHKLLIDIFEKCVEEDNSYRLFLIGNGPLKQSMMDLIKEKKLTSFVTMIDYSAEISSFMSMADLMIFPSIFEGFPISLVEAQASGLPILYSDKITNEIELLSTTQAFSLDTSLEEITNRVFRIGRVSIEERLNARDILFDKKMDTSHSIERIKELYK